MPPSYSDFLEWDVASWSRALRFWESVFPGDASLRYGLEVGAHNGGLSLFFAAKLGCKMCCTDVAFPENAQRYHQKFGLKIPIEYASADVLRLPFADGTFDFVTFKSVLGMVGSQGRFDQIEQAVAEMHRVLKPGGWLFFAENLRGSRIHTFARESFVPWGRNWHYLSRLELEHLLQIFARREIRATGFLAAFVSKPDWLKNSAAWLDSLLPFLPKNMCYVGFGLAIKR